MNIHPTAIISPDAKLGEGVQIGPYTIIGPSVTIGKNSIIGPHVVIESHTDIGEGCRVFQFASLGGLPQDLKYRGEETRVVIGNFNVIREYVTINRATSADIGVTIMGDHNLIMAYSHIAHNCKLGNYVIMGNSSNLAGHIHVDDFAIISGLTGVHQFTRIGTHCFIGGCSAVAKDVPPYVMVSGIRAKPYGLNLVGMQRRGFKEDTINAIKKAYKTLYRSSLLLKDALQKIREDSGDLPEIKIFIAFIEQSTRGILR